MNEVEEDMHTFCTEIEDIYKDKNPAGLKELDALLETLAMGYGAAVRPDDKLRHRGGVRVPALERRLEAPPPIWNFGRVRMTGANPCSYQSEHHP